MRLIDAGKLLSYLRNEKAEHELYGNISYADQAAAEAVEAIIETIENTPTVDAVEVPPTGIGDVFDGHHTFNELYHHRAILFSVVCKMLPDKAWKSRKHHDGSMYEGMFIVGIDTPYGQATYHYDVEPYWDVFEVKELDAAPIWDGHTPEDAISRIGDLGGEEIHARWTYDQDGFYMCTNCGTLAKVEEDWRHEPVWGFCPLCGAKMDKED